MSTVLVKIRQAGGTYVARAGRGRKATTASCTGLEVFAAQRAAAKYFRLDACNVQTESDIVIEDIGEGLRAPIRGAIIVKATLPECAS